MDGVKAQMSKVIITLWDARIEFQLTLGNHRQQHKSEGTGVQEKVTRTLAFPEFTALKTSLPPLSIHQLTIYSI
jgi:hypothetical protein